MRDLDPASILATRPKILIDGRIAVGKTYQVAKALNHWRWYVTNETNLSPYASRLEGLQKKYPDANYRFPKTTLVLSDDHKNLAGWYKGMITKWIAGAEAGKHDQPGLVLDEFSTLCEWINRSISGSGSRMNFDQIDEFKEIVSWTAEQFSKTDRGLCLVMHSKRERYVGERDTEATAPNFGEIKYDAGPAFPIGTVPPLMVREFDIVWEMIAEADADSPEDGISERYFLTQPGPHNLRKTRRFGAEPKEVITNKDGLREKLTRLGYRLT